MDGCSIWNWKSHVKHNGSVYSVQFTINGVSEIPRRRVLKQAQGPGHKESF